VKRKIPDDPATNQTLAIQLVASYLSQLSRHLLIDYIAHCHRWITYY